MADKKPNNMHYIIIGIFFAVFVILFVLLLWIKLYIQSYTIGSKLCMLEIQNQLGENWLSWFDTVIDTVTINKFLKRNYTYEGSIEYQNSQFPFGCNIEWQDIYINFFGWESTSEELNKEENINSEDIDEDFNTYNTIYSLSDIDSEEKRIAVCEERVWFYLNYNTWDIQWQNEEEAWASFSRNGHVDYVKWWESASDDINCFVDMVDWNVQVKFTNHKYNWPVEEVSN